MVPDAVRESGTDVSQYLLQVLKRYMEKFRSIVGRWGSAESNQAISNETPFDSVLIIDASAAPRFYAHAFRYEELEPALDEFLDHTRPTPDLAAIGFAVYSPAGSNRSLAVLPFFDMQRLYTNRAGMIDIPSVIGQAHNKLRQRLELAPFTTNVTYINTCGDPLDVVLADFVQEIQHGDLLGATEAVAPLTNIHVILTA